MSLHTLSLAQLAAGLGISGQTVGRYLDIMVDLLLVRRLQPWASNVGKRLVRSPKVYVRDSGLLHTLLGIRDQETLLGHPVVGSSWEGMLIENILSAVPANTQAWFYRTSVGAEIDLLPVNLDVPQTTGGAKKRFGKMRHRRTSRHRASPRGLPGPRRLQPARLFTSLTSINFSDKFL